MHPVPFRFARLFAPVLLAGLALAAGAHAQPAPRAVDFRFAPPYWYSALGVPDDWHKPLANDRGALLYDFGPGPYVIPLTTVGVGVRGVTLQREAQTLADPRVPVLATTLAGPGVRVALTTFSAVPDSVAGSNGRFGAYERLDGITGALGWAATPTVPADTAFRNVAWGITRPIHYRVRVAPNARKRVVLGFNESYKPRLNERVAWMRVEGAPDQQVDLALTARQHEPQVFLFDGGDADGDGWLHVEVMAPTGADPNTTLAAVWVYPAGAGLTRPALLAGGAGLPVGPELRIDAGTEMLRQAPRVDVIDATVEAAPGAVPEVTVRTRRGLHARDGALWLGDRPFVATQPAFTAADPTADGWTLALPAGTRSARVLVVSGDASAADLPRWTAAPTARLLAAANTYWRAADIPYGHVRVPDARLQAGLDAALRTLYQGRERINDRGQFNSSFTLYRGLWAGDAAYFVDVGAMIGDRARARESLQAMLDHQTEGGLYEIMRPVVFWRESAQVLWTFGRYVRLTDDRAWAEPRWAGVMRGVEALRRARATTLGTGTPYEGLFPPAFSDGGIGRIAAEYSSAYWTMIALHELARTARTLGRTDDAQRLDAFYGELRASFDAGMRRDLRRDSLGNPYLPVPVGLEGPDAVPQLAQWAVLEAHILADVFPRDGELIRGTLGVMKAAERQGLPISTGWLPGGIWAGFGGLVAHAELLQGNDARAADLLYAMANHSSPVGTWVEEQPLVGAGDRLAGDMPHNWAGTFFARTALSMLALEQGDDLHLLSAVPEEWLRAGATSALDRVRTARGDVDLTLTVSRDGRTATLTADPIGTSGQAGRLVLHTRSLRRAGFTRISGAPATGSDEAVVLPWGRAVRITFRKP